MFRKTQIRLGERGLRFRRGEFVDLLGPGTYGGLLKRLKEGCSDIQVVSTSPVKFEHAQLSTLVQNPAFREAFTIVEVADYQHGLVFRDGSLLFVLGPGTHAFFKEPRPVEVTIVSTLKTQFEHPLLDVLLQHPALRDVLTVVDVAHDQRALVKKDGRVAYLLGPGRYAFFKHPYAIEIELFGTDPMRFEHAQLDAILALPNASQILQVVSVGAHEEVLLLKDGEIVDQLGAGRHVFVIQPGRLMQKAVDRREQVLDVAGQEIMTRDPVTLRLNLIVTYQVVDARKAITVVSDYSQPCTVLRSSHCGPPSAHAPSMRCWRIRTRLTVRYTTRSPRVRRNLA